MLRGTALDHVVLRVRDLERSLAFYREVLGLRIDFLEEFRAGTRPFVSARLGDQLLDLVPDATYDPAASGASGGLLHFCVRIGECAFDALVPWLRERGVTVLEEQPVPRMGATGMGLSIYIADPDGYVVELKAA